MHEAVDIAPEVAEALAAGRPVVALETTAIAHGFPFPRNLEVARAMQSQVRGEGAVPATIGVIGGRIEIGMDDAGVEHIAKSDGVLKVSRRDLAFAVSAGRDGGTTVAATMFCARLAGIGIFATGGIGGVHRGAGDTMDISADLEELARTRVAVVCAGAKAILDLPKTLEFLETKGVPVIGAGTDEFPAFYARESGLTVPARVDTAEGIAALLRTHNSLGLDSGVLIANPPPSATAMPRETVERAVARAIADAEGNGVRGNALTPYLLDRVAEITGGDSIDANAALLENNAALAARIAVALAAGRNGSQPALT